MSRVTNKESNILYYVSDMEEIPAAGHFRKMDAGREIAMHICNGLGGASLRKYTEYQGERIEATSVGIVFPTHMWGVSLAVYTFLKHLRVAPSTYVYAIVVGESLSGSVDATLGKRLCSLDRFKRIFVEKGFGDENNIFVRCIDFVRDYDTTEEILRVEKNHIAKLETILEGLLFYDMRSMKERDILTQGYSYPKEAEEKMISWGTSVKKEEKHRLSNIFLDEEYLSGVRLCRAL